MTLRESQAKVFTKLGNDIAKKIEIPVATVVPATVVNYDQEATKVKNDLFNEI